MGPHLSLVWEFDETEGDRLIAIEGAKEDEIERSDVAVAGRERVSQATDGLVNPPASRCRA